MNTSSESTLTDIITWGQSANIFVTSRYVICFSFHFELRILAANAKILVSSNVLAVDNSTDHSTGGELGSLDACLGLGTSINGCTSLVFLCWTRITTTANLQNVADTLNCHRLPGQARPKYELTDIRVICQLRGHQQSIPTRGLITRLIHSGS